MEKASVQELYSSLVDKVNQIENQTEREDLSFFFILTPNPNDKKWKWRKSSTHYRINGEAVDSMKRNLIASFDISGSTEKPALVISFQYPSKKVTQELYFENGHLYYKESVYINKTGAERSVLKKYKDGQCINIRETIGDGTRILKTTALVRNGDRFFAIQKERNLAEKEVIKKYFGGNLDENKIFSLNLLTKPRQEKIVQK